MTFRHPLVGYGFMLSAQIPIVVTHIVPGGPAEGIIDTGDFVISIFDQKINFSSSSYVFSAIKKSSIQDMIKLSVRPHSKSTSKRRPPPPPPHKTKVRIFALTLLLQNYNYVNKHRIELCYKLCVVTILFIEIILILFKLLSMLSQFLG